MTLRLKQTANGFWGVYRGNKLVACTPWKVDSRRILKAMTKKSLLRATRKRKR